MLTWREYNMQKILIHLPKTFCTKFVLERIEVGNKCEYIVMYN